MKKTIAFLLAMVMLTSLSACGKKNADEDNGGVSVSTSGIDKGGDTTTTTTTESVTTTTTYRTIAQNSEDAFNDGELGW